MFTIAVCDDDMQERMQEVQIVKNIFSQKELEAGIEEFQTGQHFLDVLHRVPYDIVLLDIQMGEVSGFTLAEELYKITGGENIIFVSSMENLVFESIHFSSTGVPVATICPFFIKRTWSAMHSISLTTWVANKMILSFDSSAM